MLKKGLSVFIILLGITMIVVGYFYFFYNSKQLLTAKNAFSDMPFVIRVNKIDKTISDINSSKYFTLTNQPEYLKLVKFVSKNKNNNKLKDVFIIASSNTMKPVFCIESYSFAQSEKLLENLLQVFGKKKFNRLKRANLTYYSYKCGNKESLFVSTYEGLIFISNNLQSLSDINTRIKKRNATSNNPVFFKTASREANFNIYAQNKYFWTNIFSSNVFSKSSLMFNTAVLDVYLKQKVMIISGLINVEKSKLFQTIVSSTPKSFELSELAKEDIAIYKQVNINNIFDKCIDKSMLKSSFFKELFSMSLSNTITSFDNGSILAFEINSPSETRNWLRKWSSNSKNNAHQLIYKFDKSTEFLIVKFNFYKQFPILPKELFKIGKVKYSTVIGNNIVFANELSELKLICSNSVLKQNLKTSSKFKKIEHYLSSASNLFIYGNIENLLKKSVFNKSVNKLFKSEDLLNNLSNFALQLSGSNGYLYLNLIIDSNLKQEQKRSNIKWKSKLDGSAIVKPVIVINHVTSGNEIIIQDNHNILYLLNNKGRILWRKALRERIISDFYQVDKYKNGKLQYLFNTKTSLYLVDRNGNDVERFPKKFLYEATSGINVFDYDKNKRYRIFVPLKNRHIELYNIDGNTIPDWKFDKTDATVTTPIQYYRIGTRDYIIFGDTVRTYILNRKGETRILPDGKSSKSINNIYYFDKHLGQWITTMPNGTILGISTLGKITHKSLYKFSRTHHFVYADVSGNNKSEYIYLDKDSICVYNKKGERKFDYIFKNTIEEPPFIYTFSSLVKGIGIVDKKDSKVYMFDKFGKQFKGFPYLGVTPFTISHVKGYNGLQLIVGHSDGFLYDYQLP